jgi:hypothetical protein
MRTLDTIAITGILMTVQIVNASPITYGIFAVPGAVETDAWGINDSGQIAGSYVDSSGHEHGFIRSADGSTYTTVDYPGATATELFGINTEGDVVGIRNDTGSLQIQAFIRMANGNFTFFNPPGFPSPAVGINSSDQVVGSANGQGLIRNSNGTYTFFDVPGQQGNCCINVGINDAGVVAGAGFGSLNDFVRSSDGTQYSFPNPVGVGNIPVGTDAGFVGINNQDEFAGNDYGASGVRAFFCTADVATCTLFPDVPYLWQPNWQIQAHGINDSDEIVGAFGRFGGGYSFCTGPCAGSTVPTPELNTGEMVIVAIFFIPLLVTLERRRFPQSSWFPD